VDGGTVVVADDEELLFRNNPKKSKPVEVPTSKPSTKHTTSSLAMIIS